ncbi:hypothetical protein AB1Y20_008018 [Prymnesium parvum]|uniref:Protein of centriole 5 n=1 Tax=Prymnesium parvum TaxID=97485 RepID=A0AB34ITK6_PRYPA
MRLHGILRCVRGLRLSYMFWLWRQTAERHHPRAQVVELAREVAMLRTHCSSRDETIKELSAQFAEARQTADSLSASLDKERTTLEARLSYRQEEVLELRSQLQRASVEMRGLSVHLTHVRVLILRQLFEHCSREALRVAVLTWSAAMRSASGGLTQSQLAQDHLELTHQFHLLKRRLDAALADKGRLQASAAARDRELQQEASALRSALLAAGASHQERVGGAGIQATNPAVSSLSTSMAGKDGRLDLPTVHDDERNRKVSSPPSSVRRGHNLPPEAMAEVLTLRRKLQAVHADNALLTQNFMMVKTRLSDVSAQREADHNSMQAVHARLEASMDLQLGQLARAHRSILRSATAITPPAI